MELKAFQEYDWTFLGRAPESIKTARFLVSDWKAPNMCKLFPLLLMSELKYSLGERRSYDRSWFDVAWLISDQILASHIAMRFRHSDSFNILKFKHFCRNRHLVALSVELNVASFRRASLELRDDELFVRELMMFQPRALIYASPRLTTDKRELVLAAVEKCGRILFDLPSKWRDDREIVLAAVKNDGSILGDGGSSFQDDLEVVLAAVKQHESALQYASDRLKLSPEILVVLDGDKKKTEKQYSMCHVEHPFIHSPSSGRKSDHDTQTVESEIETVITFRNLAGEPLVFLCQRSYQKTIWEEKIATKLNVPKCLVSVHASESNSELASEEEQIEGSFHPDDSVLVLAPGEEYGYLVGCQTFASSGKIPSLEDNSFWTRDKLEVWTRYTF